MSGDVVTNAGEQLDSLTMDPKTEPLVEANPPEDLLPNTGPAPPDAAADAAAAAADEAARTKRIAELEEKALEARSKRQYEKLEEKVQKRQMLEAKLLEAERKFRDEKVARKEAEENFDEVQKRLNDATNSRLKAEEQASTLMRTEDEIKKMEAIVSKLKDRVPVLTTELEKTLAVAHEQSLELSSFDAASSQQSRVIEQERLEMANSMDEELRTLGLAVARLAEHVNSSDSIAERDSEVLKSLLHDETKMLFSAQSDVEMRKGEIKQIDARLNRIMKTLELTQEAHHHLKTNMDNTGTLLEEAKENDQREYKYMHRRLTMPYMREELHYDPDRDRSDPLPHTKPNRAVPIERFANRKPLPSQLTPEEIEMAEEAKRAETDSKINGSLDFAFNVMKKPSDPLDQPPLEAVPKQPLAEVMSAQETEGEQLVSQSIQLLKEMQAKQAMTNQSFNKHADHYQMSLDRLDKEIKMHQKHLEEVEEGDFSEWNKHIAKTPEPAPDVGGDGFLSKGGKVKSHVEGKSLLELFHYYDQDDSGTVNKGELICILSDLGVLDGLSPDDSAKALDEAYAKADDNGDGGINYKEFSIFMNSFSHVKPKASLPQNIPDSFKQNGKDEIVWQIYLQHCSKKYPQEMGSAQFIRAMRKSGFVDEKVNPSATAILFAKSRKPMAKRMQYADFLRALAHMATIRGLSFEEAATAFANKAILRPITNVGAPRDKAETEDYNDPLAQTGTSYEEAQGAAEEESQAIKSRMQEAEDARFIREAAEAEAAEELKMSKAAERTKEALLKKAAKPVDMNSWETKQAIDDIGQSAVPKSMVEASGKRMSIRDLYNKFDEDNSGELDQHELAKLITDLEMLKDLTEEEVPIIVEEYFKKADVNNDGKVSFDEFAIFYMDLKDVKKAGTSHIAVKVPKKWKQDEDLKALFVQHCSFGKGNRTLDEMDGAAFAKMCSNSGLLDEKLTNTTVDLIFTKSKPKGKRKLNFPDFLESLALVASYKGYEFDELILIVVEAGAPKLAGKPAGGSTGTRKTSLPGMSSGSGLGKAVTAVKAVKAFKPPAGADLKPVPMQNASGKNMTVREMFDTYDPDKSGVLDRIEFGKLVVELQLTKGLNDSEAGKAIDRHYLKCDVKGEGNIDFREFSNWYKELLGEKPAAGPSSVPKVPKEYKKNADFKALFIKHCSFGKGNKMVEVLDGAAFVKCLKHSNLITPKLTTTSADILFTKSKEKGQRTIKWVQFLEALALCAGALGKTFEEVADAVMEAGPPKKG